MRRDGVTGAYLCAALAGLAIASAAFVHHRNRSFATRELARARAAAAEVAAGRTPLGHVIASGVVAPAAPSQRYPFLRRRHVVGGRALGGATAPATDKLLYDAAARAERAGPHGQADGDGDARASFAAFLDDGTGRVVAAEPTRGGTAVVVSVPPSGPERFPAVVVLGLLALGALVAAAGATLGGVARTLGLAGGASALAVPTIFWAGPIPALAIGLVACAVAWADRRGHLAAAAAELSRQRAAYAFLLPAAVAMLILVAVPFAVGLVLGFYDHSRGVWRFVGLANFLDILRGGGRSFADPLNFWFTLGVTVAWTAVNVALHVVLGVCLALCLRQSWLRGKGVYRMLLILPWAIPNYITALLWRGMFQSEYGAVNAILGALGLDKVSWFSSFGTAFAANVTANTWLGFPFMMVVALGALESIPRDMIEAAEVDGASAWQRFFHLTLPHLRPALLPAIVLGSIWTFNMFNVIYLVSEGRPGGGTDILVTQAYRWAFERGERYGMAAAYATLIFLILLVWTVAGMRAHRQERAP
jgi:ABC-type sugar transport system permease subunit